MPGPANINLTAAVAGTVIFIRGQAGILAIRTLPRFLWTA